MEQGIYIPKDLSVIGIDDSDLARFCEVPLTSARNPVRELGRAAALEMLEMLEGKAVPKATELKPEISSYCRQYIKGGKVKMKSKRGMAEGRKKK